MNCFDDTHGNNLRLCLFLTLVDRGTYVYVEFEENDTVFIKRITNATDILNVCEKGTQKLGHHPRIVNVRTEYANNRAVLKVRCF